MQIEYNPIKDEMHIGFNFCTVRTRQYIDDNVMLEKDENNNIVGIWIYNVSDNFSAEAEFHGFSPMALKGYNVCKAVQKGLLNKKKGTASKGE